MSRVIWVFFVVVEMLQLGVTIAITLLTSLAFGIYDRRSRSLYRFERLFHASVATCGIALWMLLIVAAVSWRWAACRVGRLHLMLVLKHSLPAIWASIAAVQAISHLPQACRWNCNTTLRYIHVTDSLHGTRLITNSETAPLPYSHISSYTDTSSQAFCNKIVHGSALCERSPRRGILPSPRINARRRH